MVPTVDRGLRLAAFWSIDTAGDSPSMKSTSGLSICPRNCRAYADSDSTYRRWPSAKIVSKARLDLPEPDSPVNTIKASRGRSIEMSLRLCSRAPRTTSRSATGPLLSALCGSAWALFVRIMFPLDTRLAQGSAERLTMLARGSDKSRAAGEHDRFLRFRGFWSGRRVIARSLKRVRTSGNSRHRRPAGAARKIARCLLGRGITLAPVAPEAYRSNDFEKQSCL